MNFARNRLLRSTAFVDRIVGACLIPEEGEGGGGGGEAEAAAAAAAAAAKPEFDAEAWKTARVNLAGGDVERAKVLEAFETPDALFARVTAPEPIDWRKQMAGDDPEELKALERYADPAAARKAWKAATAEISAGGKVKIPGENATPEEIAAFTKAIGVPEKVDGYQITAKPPEGYQVTENDTGFLTGLTAKLHEKIANGAKPNDIINFAHQFYYDAQADAVLNEVNAAADAAVAGERENKALWGAEYDANIRTAIAAAKHFFPGKDDEFEALMGTRLDTGHALFDHPVIQRMFAQIGRTAGVSEDPFFQAARGDNPGFDPVKRKQEILAMREGTSAQRAEYIKLSAPGGELEKINNALAKKRAA